MEKKVYLGLGANLGDPQASFAQALCLLDQTPSVRLLRVSTLYRTAPIGPPGQPEYTNGAVELETSLSPLELLERCQTIERQVGRVEGPRWGPRLLDLDLLLYGPCVLWTDRLILPHPRLRERLFVLAPLAELCPEHVVPPSLDTILLLRHTLEREGVQGVVRLDFGAPREEGALRCTIRGQG